MSNRIYKQFRQAALVTVLAGVTASCNVISRLADVGSEPQLTQIQNPTAAPNYRPVSMPTPAPRLAAANPNSLWRAGARAFFRDLRAKEVGDIVTVVLQLDDSATLENTTERERDDTEETSFNNFFGIESQLGQFLPDEVVPGSLIDLETQSETEGEGEIERSEQVNLTFAAVITQVLPNGNLVIVGRQEVRVNAELRELMVTGVIRPGDIDSDNTIAHTQIAEMRVAYGGRGTLSELQQPRWGTQIWDIVFPF